MDDNRFVEAKIRIIKWIAFILLMLPLVTGAWQFYNDALGANPDDSLGANPIEAITHHTGEWALRILLLTLAVSPARRILTIGFATPIRQYCA